MKLLEMKLERNRIKELLSNKNPGDMGYHYLSLKLRRMNAKIKKLESQADPYSIGMRVY